MNRSLIVMTKILDFELKRISCRDWTFISSLPRYSERKRGPFLVVFWHDRLEKEESRVIVQVWLRKCLGMSSLCARGIKITPYKRWVLPKNEMYSYY